MMTARHISQIGKERLWWFPALTTTRLLAIANGTAIVKRSPDPSQDLKKNPLQRQQQRLSPALLS